MSNETSSPVWHTSGSKRWYLNGKLHREDGPAVEYPNGTKEWWLNGFRHRGSGPAIEGKFGDLSWYKHGQLHREDGPAVEWANDSGKSWFLNGKLIYDDYELSFVEGNYIVVERGIPTDKMFGNLKLTKSKLLTAEGTILAWDNLPGLVIVGNDE
jgi:hypothetical protein